MSQIKDKPVTAFLDELASSAATPGGGSAAAIMGGMGAALVSMVCNLTIGKKAYVEVEGDMKDLLAKAEALRTRLTDFIRADVEAFDGLMAAYGLPKDTDEQKAARSAAIQEGLKKATDAPLACARACADVIALSRVAAEKGNTNVVSDAGVAALAALAALRSAALNVDINVPSIKDADFAASRRAETDALLAKWVAEADRVVEVVKSKL
ncbi:Methenyltetrahydrofolate cyclohydrolase [Methyloversatilis universalis FAM5]|uniref:Methenyltetrahydrofolate cyclohydrolase n=1 Tax=Methyloversatilis universalis (strain ATCC BAA-1314 / DSM 25237 / JCM 13912 / CCUG 52030 / FAM5) TaxID=1000565 RepID=F5R8M2_METUF|nr:methenyltetrahydrofolate cyclohydrolase [Methyloversatilis universalis]EGK73400.1 Methenyltetrahydrofolate cyclohydrolase [Methyloversatilis universalis FAM5]